MSASLLTIISATALAVGPPPAADPAALVRQLGSEKYAVRAGAERRLLALGGGAVPAVEAGRRDADLEVRRRCQRLLEKLRVAVCASRVKALRAGRPGHAVPLWDHYRRAAGNTAESRRLFADAYESEPQLFEEVAAALRRGAHGAAGALCDEQARQLRDQFLPAKHPEKGDEQALPAAFEHRLAAALLVGALPGVRLSDEGWKGLSEGPLLCQVRFDFSLKRGDGRARLLRDLLGRWCEAARSDTAMSQALRQAAVRGLDGPARTVARRSLAYGQEPMLLAQALKALGRCGEPEDIPRVLPWLKREEEYHADTHWPSPELSDDALAALVLLTGQRAKDYGTEPCSGLSGEHIRNAAGKVLLEVPGQRLGCFRSQKDREAAFRKWDGWAAKHWARLGLPPPRPAKPGGFEPRRAHAAARDAALGDVVCGHRMRYWGKVGVRARELIELAVHDDRVSVDTPLIGGKFAGQTATWGGRSSGLGATSVRVSTDEAGLTTYALTAVAWDDDAGTLGRTVIAACSSGTFTLDAERRELTTALLVRYEQRGKVTLRVERTRHRDGQVLHRTSATADDLAALREADPAGHALLLSLLRQTNAVAPTKRSP